MRAIIVICLFFAVSLFTGFKLAYTRYEFVGWFTEILILLLYFAWKERKSFIPRTISLISIVMLLTEIFDELKLMNNRLTGYDYYYPVIGVFAIIVSILYHYTSNKQQTK